MNNMLVLMAGNNKCKNKLADSNPGIASDYGKGPYFFSKGIGFLFGLKFFALSIFSKYSSKKESNRQL